VKARGNAGGRCSSLRKNKGGLGTRVACADKASNGIVRVARYSQAIARRGNRSRPADEDTRTSAQCAQ
jgi:hypothetical protein